MSARQPVATYKYDDENGVLLYEALRYSPKDFRARRPGPDGQWIWNLEGVRRVIYRLGGILEIGDDQPLVFIVEGEKDVDALVALGLNATTNPGGAGKWRDEYSPFLKGAHAVILPDNDAPGLKHAKEVASSVGPHARSVKILLLPGLPPKGDVSDWLEAGGDKEQLLELVASAEPLAATGVSIKGSPTDTGNSKQLARVEGLLSSQNSLISQGETAWPSPLKPEALHGLVGEIIRILAPYTEADPAGILATLLVALGNVFGTGAYFVAEADRHYLRLNAQLVGETSKGRKGVATGRALGVLDEVDLEWLKNNVGGLSSGEGLIWAVRDPIYKKEPVREKGKILGYQDVLEDPGVADKRLLVVETEFVRALKVMGREGNVLSAVIRQAWDNGNLNVLTKNTPAKATGAHICIVGHITKQELLRYFDSTEAANGFGNRFLWVAVRRSKFLPDGGDLQRHAIQPLKKRLQQVVAFAKEVGEIRRDSEAAELWRSGYQALSEGSPGLVGAVTGRAEAQVMRLACIYAVLDQSKFVRAPHLRAALAFWKLAEESARFIFGGKSGDPTGDEILKALRTRGELTQTDISGLFGRHKNAEQLANALEALQAAGLIKSGRQDTGGHPRAIWRAL